jgi:DNA-directed RNA polymerase specialized sigma subunit
MDHDILHEYVLIISKDLEHYKTEYFSLRKEYGCLKESYQGDMQQKEAQIEELGFLHRMELDGVEERVKVLQSHVGQCRSIAESRSHGSCCCR